MNLDICNFKYNEDTNSESESNEEPEENEGSEEDEGDNAPAMFQDESDDEVQLQPQQGFTTQSPPVSFAWIASLK